MDAVDTLYANTRNNPIEDIESHLPLRVERYELREDACAAGQWRGGIGAIREFTYLDDGGASVEGEGHKFAPVGIRRRPAGLPGRADRPAGGRRATPLALEGPVHAGPRRRRFIVVGPSGGGYGDARQRAPEHVLADVLDGYISAETAARDYAVVIATDGTIDREATARARANPGMLA